MTRFSEIAEEWIRQHRPDLADRPETADAASPSDPPAAPAVPATERPPAGYRIVRREPRTPPVLLPSGSKVVDVELFVRTTLCQLDNYLQGKTTFLSGNWGLRGLLDRLVACGVEVELEDARRAEQ